MEFRFEDTLTAVPEGAMEFHIHSAPASSSATPYDVLPSGVLPMA